MQSRVLVTAALVLAFLIAGCEQQAPPPIATDPPKPTPEESFAEILRVVKSSVESANRGRVIRFPDGGQCVVKYRVDGSYMKPTERIDKHRGVIHVQVVTQYIARVPDSTEDVDPAVPDNTISETEIEMLQDPNVELDYARIRAAAQRAPTVATSGARSHSNESQITHEFAYVDSRWKLTTELDVENANAVRYALEMALQNQLPGR